MTAEPYHSAMLERTRHRRQTHSHGHAELLQPLLFQLFGLEEELEAALALVVSEVESVGPLQEGQNTHKFEAGENFLFFFCVPVK